MDRQSESRIARYEQKKKLGRKGVRTEKVKRENEMREWGADRSP
jgi:hypothetical protein